MEELRDDQKKALRNLIDNFGENVNKLMEDEVFKWVYLEKLKDFPNEISKRNKRAVQDALVRWYETVEAKPLPSPGDTHWSTRLMWKDNEEDWQQWKNSINNPPTKQQRTTNFQATNKLFSGDGKLVDRMDNFRKKLPFTNSELSCLLFFGSPSEYFLFEKESANDFAQKLGVEEFDSSTASLERYFQVCKAVCQEIAKRKDVIEAVNNFLSGVRWQPYKPGNFRENDSAHHLLTQVLISKSNKIEIESGIMTDVEVNAISVLENSKNIVFNGAPGTGKTYLAKNIARKVIEQTMDEKQPLDSEAERLIEEHVGFVQFHPSYDYTDFVEGLRPVKNDNGDDISFELRPGIFKEFCDKAKKDGDGLPYVFIIDEINRGEISKIFGELFFSIDPGYRGENGSVCTQYSNMHDDPTEKFCVPENVYIIGTMNDIDRSVESFDFAIRRRFRFIEIKADDPDQLAMLNALDEDAEEAKKRLQSLNEAIENTDGLSSSYHVGPSYFLKLNEIDSDDGNNKYEVLWKEWLRPLLAEYLRGEAEAEDKLKKLYEEYLTDKPSIDSNSEEEYATA
jgi:DNA polymerase III delta prime subunit